MRKILLLLLALTAFFNCTFEPPTKPTDWYTNPVSYSNDSAAHPRGQLFQAYLDSAVAERLPGGVLLIRTPQEGTWVGASGYADIASRASWQPATLSRVGSVTKTFAATVILKLYGESLLDLDDLAKTYLPKEVVSKIANAESCTIRQLLNQTSGIHNYLAALLLVSESYGSYRYAYHPKERLLEYSYNKKAEYAPGTSWNYSNSNFVLLEMIAEKATGRDSRELMDSLVIQALDLKCSIYNPGGDMPKGMARGYADFFTDGRLIDVTDTEIENFHYDGGLVSTVYDLASFIDALFQTPFLSEKEKEALVNAVDTQGQSERGTDFYGCGIILEKHPLYGNVYGHSGTATGYTAHVYHVEEENITVAAIINGSQNTIEERSYKWFSPLKFDKILRLAVDEK